MFHAVISRKLGPPLYAEFSVVHALLLALSRPLSILSGVITRVAVTGRFNGVDFKDTKDFCMKLGVILALAVGFGSAILSPFFKMFLKIDNILLFLPLAVTLLLLGLTAVWRGLFASIESFAIVSYSSIAELFLRGVSGIILVFLGFKVFGALSGSALGVVAAFCLLYSRRKQISKSYNERKQETLSNSKFGSISAKVFFIAIPAGFFLELDLLLSKRFFSPHDAGIYAAAALIGKGLLIFTTVASAVVYPRLVEERLSKRGLLAFFWGIAITLIFFILGYAALKLIGKPIVSLLFGDKYVGVAELVPIYTIALIPLAVHLQIANYKGAIGGWAEGLWLWIILVGYYVSLEIFSSSIPSYLRVIFIFHLIFAPLSFFILYIRNKKANTASVI